MHPTQFLARSILRRAVAVLVRSSLIFQVVAPWSFFPTSRARGEVVLYGADSAGGNLLRINTETGHGTVVGPLGVPFIAALAFDPNHNILFGSSTSDDVLVSISTETGAATTIGGFGTRNFTFHAIGYDSIHDRLFGAQGESGFISLWRIDTGTGAATIVGTSSTISHVGDMTFDRPNNRMYLADFTNGSLYTINLTDASLTLIGSTGIVTSGMGVGLAYHPSIGLFASHNHVSLAIDDELYAVDPVTAHATLVGPIDAGNVAGLAFVEVSEGIPADLNGDGVVNSLDLGILLSSWTLPPAAACFGSSCQADLNGDNIVNSLDLGIMLASWTL